MPFEKGTTIVARPGDPAYEASRQKGFRVRWLVAGNYEIKNALLVPVHASEWRDYYPATQKTIPIQLAKIEEGDEKALLSFARRYGSLGFTGALPFVVGSILAKRLLPSDRKSIERLRTQCGLPDMEIWKAWIASGGEGDPLPWIWAHVRTLRFCVDLGLYIEDADDEGLVSFFRKYQWAGSRHARESHPALEVAIQHEVSVRAWALPSGWTVLEFARYLRRELINKNLQDLHFGLEPEGDREKSYFQFRSLIEMAYWHLLNEAEHGTIKRCERPGCGGFFVQMHGRERFCPEPTTGPKKESRCAVLNRVLNAKKRQGTSRGRKKQK